MSARPLVLAATHIAAAGVGWWIAPRELLDGEVKHTGFFQVDATKVLATTVESLREENKLLVFSYKGSARVQAVRTKLWLFNGSQELIVPAVVNYYLDLHDLKLSDVSFNEQAKLVTVRLPKLSLGEIAFQPENATAINGGLLTFSQEQVEALNKANYRSARRAMVKQAQGSGLVNAAKRQAMTNVSTYFEIPLRIAGLPDVKVVATFR